MKVFQNEVFSKSTLALNYHLLENPFIKDVNEKHVQQKIQCLIFSTTTCYTATQTLDLPYNKKLNFLKYCYLEWLPSVTFLLAPTERPIKHCGAMKGHWIGNWVNWLNPDMLPNKLSDSVSGIKWKDSTR